MSTLENLKTHFLPELTPEQSDLVEIQRGTLSGKATVGLVRGTQFVDVLLDPVGLTTAPFYTASPEFPGLTVIPAPGPGKTILVLSPAYSTVTDGDAWGDTAAAVLYWGDPTQGTSEIFGGAPIQDRLNEDLSVNLRQTSTVDVNGIPSGPPPDTDNLPVVVQTQSDITQGGSVFGTRSLLYRIFYLIVPSYVDTPFVFFHITDLNQGTKTFTVSPDPTGTTGAVTVVGSTGNDGSYTIISTTATTIVVANSIPSATADGWVKVAV